jgi:folate-dependent phosphoribosylglycinamide formyltransferase PurN
VSGHKNEICIGVLGMPDNSATSELLDYLVGREGIKIDFVVYWKPSPRDQLKRLTRKLKHGGVFPALERTYHALFRSALRSRVSAHDLPFRRYYVSGHNSLECAQILRQEKVDILLLATDAIITTKILQIPKLATLNAHPGWAPRFRGVGSNLYQMESGEYPAISVHQVDEGIDTGPLILREQFRVNYRKGLKQIEAEIAAYRHRCLAKAVRMFVRGEVRYLDTFLEPSNMTRGMALKRQRKLEKRLRSGTLVLKSSLQS